MIQGLKEKLEMAETFMESADFLEQPLYYAATGESKEEIETRTDKQRVQKKKMCHFLYAVVFEFAIKIIWEIENGKKCKLTHNILELYKELSCEKQSKIRDLYDMQAAMIRTQEGRQRTGNQIRVNDLTKFQSLEEALEANYDTVTDFKYDGLFQGKSSVIGGVIWNTKGFWVFPKHFVVFPRELLEYARENVGS